MKISQLPNEFCQTTKRSTLTYRVVGTGAVSAVRPGRAVRVPVVAI